MFDPDLFPVLGLEAVADTRHQWTALSVQSSPKTATAAVLALLGQPETQAAFAPLDCIVPLAEPLAIDAALVTSLPADRIVLQVPAAALQDAAVRQHCAGLAEQGFRLLVEGEAGVHAPQAGIKGVAHGGSGLPSALSLLSLPGPHWAHGVADTARFAACRDAGMGWFSGPYARRRATDPKDGAGDGTTRKRLLSLLGLLAQDADSRELESVLKQDPALSYHLLKLVNSAAFGFTKPIHNFSQAINVLGRRQLQRWLQLLLYARPQQDGSPNLLLPEAARRAAQMEALCSLLGHDRDRQDLAFVVGVFALLDELLAMPMADIVAALPLDLDVVGALLDRAGPFGAMLALVEQPVPDPAAIAALGLTPEQFWQSQLQGWRWAIQVSRTI
ncbi:HDOD domain-containing protein [Pseudoduganella lutea]|uniref:HDOD domain-containing protein n=2 Tax=Pseudoduganella lutea TaxID=321985 RepID=A0A4P6L800_9BURK|nr:HDOD domain-containing protein [Pseudoduganella lutea]